MDDKKIIALYFKRDPDAIRETADKYGGYCTAIARNILDSDQDAEECVNDTYLHAWNAIPPRRPNVLSAFLGRITRNLSLDRFRRRQAEKRGGGQMEQVLDELTECLSAGSSVEDEVDGRELARAVNGFLDTLPREKYILFLCRYWYAYPTAAIAERSHMTEAAVSAALSRLRAGLRDYLNERGFEL